MNATQLIAVLREAGWPEDRDLLVTMAAIGLAESSGNPKAHNGRAPDDSYGIWQINLYGNLRAERLRKYNLSSPQDLFNPVTNAEIALDLYRHGGGFRNWGAYTHPIGNPRYKKFLAQANAAYNGGDNNNTADNTNDSDTTETVTSGLGVLALILLVGWFLG